jgi:hypothetical protein
MSDRLPWQRGDRPDYFIATMPDGTAEIWHQETGAGTIKGWTWRIICGETRDSHPASSKQDAADKATEAWPKVLARERARMTKLEDRMKLEEQITAAHRSGRVDVMAFGLMTSDYQRLIDINGFLRKQGWLGGPLKPLAEAVSNELFRRRSRGR